ncbi:protein of unknown function [Bacillus velezensis]|nr:protein of unknown function [Bacillus velezensis]
MVYGKGVENVVLLPVIPFVSAARI